MCAFVYKLCARLASSAPWRSCKILSFTRPTRRPRPLVQLLLHRSCFSYSFRHVCATVCCGLDTWRIRRALQGATFCPRASYSSVGASPFSAIHSPYFSTRTISFLAFCAFGSQVVWESYCAVLYANVSCFHCQRHVLPEADTFLI